MTEPGSFETAINVSGSWPKPPTLWSFSALEEVELCPRRYALKRASYPDLWDRPGYPERVSEAGIVGVVVHEGVQVVLLALNQAGCASLAEEKAVQVVRRLGGFGEIASRALDAHLRRLATNPRMSSQVDRLRQRLENRYAEMRQAIQALVSQSPIIHTTPDVARARSADHPISSSSRLAVGTHPEATLVAEADRFTGRIDLVAVHPDHVDIIDFKTGKHSKRHTRQLQLYGLLWLLDEAANPNRLPVRSLTLAYVNDRATVPAPDDWEALRTRLQEEIAAADDLVRQRPPVASPSAECWHCPVRQMCDEYWRSAFVVRDPGVVVTDAEVRILSRNGPTSWRGALAVDGTEVLLRTNHDGSLHPGKTVRILDLLASKSEDFDGLILTLTQGSEVFGPVDDRRSTP